MRGRRERGDQVVHVEHESPRQGHTPQREFLGPLLPGISRFSTAVVACRMAEHITPC